MEIDSIESLVDEFIVDLRQKREPAIDKLSEQTRAAVLGDVRDRMRKMQAALNQGGSGMKGPDYWHEVNTHANALLGLAIRLDPTTGETFANKIAKALK